MEKQILEYKVLCQEFSKEITTQVNDLIKQGWQPYYALFEKNNYLYQVMVKYEVVY